MPDERLIRLQDEIERTSPRVVAARIGVSRPTLSLVCSGRYPANPQNILARFDAVYGQVQCPHLKRELTGAECIGYHAKPRPSNPIGLQHWRACQQCPHKS